MDHVNWMEISFSQLVIVSINILLSTICFNHIFLLATLSMFNHVYFFCIPLCVFNKHQPHNLQFIKNR
jgi:hypothetical protein